MSEAVPPEREISERNGSGGRLDAFKIDQILTSVVKPIGFWQIFCAISVALASPNTITLSIFFNSLPQHRCRLPSHVEAMLNITSWSMKRIAETFSSYRSRNELVHSCEVYPLVYTTNTTFERLVNVYLKRPLENLSTIKCPDGYIFEYSPHQYSGGIAHQWNLVCDQAWELPLNESVYMAGMLIGFIGGGCVGDRIGRRRTIIFAGLLEFFLCLLMAVSMHNSFYVILRLLISITFTTRLTSTSVLMAEITTAQTRSSVTVLNTIVQMGFIRCLIAIAAYLIPNWRIMTALVMSLEGLIVPLWFILPESPKWLAAKGRHEDAADVLFRGYLWNRRFRNSCLRKRNRVRSMSKEEFLAECGLSCLAASSGESGEKDHTHTDVSTPSFLNLFNRQMAKNTIMAILLFTVQITCIFGMMFYSTNIREHISFVVMLNGLVTIPGAALSACLYRVFHSRKLPLFLVYLCCALCLWTAALYTLLWKPEKDILLNVFTNIIILLLFAAVEMLFIYIPELYDPLYRNRALGLAAGSARLGALVYPLINRLDIQVAHGSPVAVYAILISVQLCLVTFLSSSSGEATRQSIAVSNSDSEIATWARSTDID